MELPHIYIGENYWAQILDEAMKVKVILPPQALPDLWVCEDAEGHQIICRSTDFIGPAF